MKDTPPEKDRTLILLAKGIYSPAAIWQVVEWKRKIWWGWGDSNSREALRYIVFESDFSDSDLGALNSLEVAAPASEELCGVMPAHSVATFWLSPLLESEPPEVVKDKVRSGLACAISVWSGTDPDEIPANVANILQRLGFPIREGAAP